MGKDEIYAAIKELACSQGFYGRLLRDIEDDQSILDGMAEMGFTDTLDMVMWLEG